MPRQSTFTKEKLLSVAVEIIRKEGADRLTARSIANKLRCSVSPLFREYTNMNIFFSILRKHVEEMLVERLSGAKNYRPTFKEFGIRFIRFATEEKNSRTENSQRVSTAGRFQAFLMLVKSGQDIKDID